MKDVAPEDAQVAASQRRILTHSGWLFAAQLLTAVLALAQSAMMARALGVESYGVVALVSTFTLTVSQLFNSRVWEAVVKFVPRYRARGEPLRATAVLQHSYLIEAAAAVLAVAVVLLAAELAERLLVKQPGASGLVRLYSLVILLNAPYEATAALLRVTDRFRWLAYHSAALAGLRTVAVALAWWLQPTVRGMLVALLVAAAAGLGILAWMGLRAAVAAELPFWRPSAFGALRGERREVLRFTLLTNVIGTARIVSANADTLVLGLLGTPAAVGVYELAKKLATQLRYFSSGVYEATYPEISKLIAGGGHAVAKKLQAKLSRALLALVVPLCLAANLVSPWVIPRLFGAEFHPSILLFNVLVWQLLWLGLVWFPGYLLALGRVRLLTAVNSIDALVYLLLLALLIPPYGALGAAVAALSRQLLWMAMAGVALRRVRSGDPDAETEPVAR